MRTFKSAEPLARSDQLAWKIAEVAADPVAVELDVAEMIGNRIIDNAAVAAAAIARRAVASARSQALAHPFAPGSTVFGLPPTQRISPEWAAWANGVAVRELDFHDTFLAADYSHPGDNIPPLLAVGQHCGLSGADLIRGLAAAYEIQIDLVKGICLHEHKIDHIAHLGPSAAAGIGALLRLPVATIYQAVQQALHVTTTTRQSRKGEISSWKAYAPAFAGKMAIEAVDRVMRGEGAPSPAYEGEDGFIAWLLGGPNAEYVVPLPEQGEAKRAILDMTFYGETGTAATGGTTGNGTSSGAGGTAGAAGTTTHPGGTGGQPSTGGSAGSGGQSGMGSGGTSQVDSSASGGSHSSVTVGTESGGRSAAGTAISGGAGSGGVSGGGGQSAPAGGQGSGCKCSMGGRDHMPGLLLPVLAGLGLLLFRRRRDRPGAPAARNTLPF